MKLFMSIAVAALLLVPASALATLELDLAFDPAEACPGDDVQFFFALENVGGEDEMVEFGVTFVIAEYEFGPFTMEFPLAAGEEIVKEATLFIPPPVPPVTMTVSVTATDSAGTVEDEASLTVLDCGDRQSGKHRVEKSTHSLAKSFVETLNKLGLE